MSQTYEREEVNIDLAGSYNPAAVGTDGWIL